jgi:ABC-type Zn uptake system ZnuABC Zn-binding protein ZnuA
MLIMLMKLLFILLHRKHVISTVVSEANEVEKSGLAAIDPDFSTSAATQPALEMTTFLSFLKSALKSEFNVFFKRRITPYNLTLFTISLIFCFLLCSCRKENTPAADAGKLKVAATIFPLADIARNIGGDKITVITIMPPGASPHTFEINPRIVESAMGMTMLFKIGAGLDNWAEGITGAMREKPQIVDLSKVIRLRKLPDGSADPHYWLNLENGMIIAKTIADSLSVLDPADTEFYQENLTKYLEELRGANDQLKKMFVNLPDKKLATFHEAWFYFAQAYGLEVTTAFEPFPGKEPTPEFLAEFTKTIKENKIKVIFTEPQFSTEVIIQVAKDLGVKLQLVDPEGGGSPETMSYISMMKFNANTIYNALRNQ